MQHDGVDLIGRQRRHARGSGDIHVGDIARGESAGLQHPTGHHLRVRPGAAGRTDLLAPQVLAPLDLGLRDHGHGVPHRIGPDRFELRALRQGGDKRGNAGRSHVDLAAAPDQGPQGRRPTLKGEDLGLDAVLREDPRVLGDPDRNVHQVGRRCRHGKPNRFQLRLRRSRARRHGQETDGGQHTDRSNHAPPHHPPPHRLYSSRATYNQGAIRRSRCRSTPVSTTPMIISTTTGTNNRSMRKVFAYCTIM